MKYFVVAGNPIPKERARVMANKRAFTPSHTTEAERTIKFRARSAGVKPTSGSVSIRLAFYRDSGRKCDLDNLCKTVLDALNGGIAYRDDSQVVCIHATKNISKKDPRTEIWIYPTQSIGRLDFSTEI
jgi:Holliday junction resolvase RusA-like endonuclease